MFLGLARWLTQALAPRNASLGTRGERCAAQYLKRQGYRLITINWRCFAGEIDLIFADGEELVIVEVKTRSAERVRPEQQVGPAKQAKLRRLTSIFLRKHPWSGPVRFDVVAVVMSPEGQTTIRHHKRAFTA